MGFLGVNGHGVCYCWNAAQRQYLRRHQFDSPLKIPYGHIILQLVGRKNAHAWRIGGIISDGCFTIVLRNGQFDVTYRSRWQIATRKGSAVSSETPTGVSSSFRFFPCGVCSCSYSEGGLTPIDEFWYFDVIATGTRDRETYIQPQ